MGGKLVVTTTGQSALYPQYCVIMSDKKMPPMKWKNIWNILICHYETVTREENVEDNKNEA